MKCTNKQEQSTNDKDTKKWHKILKNIAKAVLCLAVLGGTVVLCTFMVILSYDKDYVDEYEASVYNRSLYQGELFAKDLCVTDTDVLSDAYTPDESLTAAGLFDLNNQQVVYAKSLFEKLYPASTTKIMTAYLTLKYGNLEDMLTITEEDLEFEDPDAIVSGLKDGDEVSLKDVLNCLLLYSGNDCGIVIAKHISGSEEAFVDLMNQEALKLGATQTHFCNPHGLHDENHYTTGYDLYLMFNACAEYPEFIEIISQKSYTATVTNADKTKEITWKPTNYYSLGEIEAPEGIQIFGGKTGSTDEAGSCVVLYGLNEANEPFISVTMGASERDILYENTNALVQAEVIDQ